MSARGGILLFAGGAVLGLAVSVLVGYLVFYRGLENSVADYRDRFDTVQSERDKALAALADAQHTIDSGIGALIIDLGNIAAGEREDQITIAELIRIERGRQENNRRALEILQRGKVLE